MAFISLPQIGIRDILDILVVAYFLYIVLMWIKDTRTWALLKGVVIILVVAILSYVLQLHTVWWIISNTITVGTIVLIVVFQPELRRALEQIGRGRIFNSLLNAGDADEGELTDDAINGLAKACMHMSKCKTGALIVIEQDTKLGDVERTGIPIDAVITSQLLINIFEKNTPLHDGAVIVRNNRVSAATCFLPLSDSMEISKDLGTRHRAAIGLSEVTDAIVLVVSEETGNVSYVRNGKIKRGLDMELIKKILTATRKKKRSEIKMSIWKGKRKDE
ncbi:TIGR00159 family protein [Sporanaerobium hydrogeniformans]|uniref:TIGR00159 family protein n=1 Tax=Sporanaerobium hydrogeniformans TaxID=3072179 RepID=A0AC61DDV7_9FIRM|nr:TIGR00159 family protein [Sporanaerobium hydrogeniformans]